MTIQDGRDVPNSDPEFNYSRGTELRILLVSTGHFSAIFQLATCVFFMSGNVWPLKWKKLPNMGGCDAISCRIMWSKCCAALEP